MINRYSLADHLVKIKLPGTATDLNGFGGKIVTIGGPGSGNGSFVGSITLRRAAATWTTTGDPTGSWVHSKSKNKTGSVIISMNQIADDVVRFLQIAKAYEDDITRLPGAEITVFNGDSLVATAVDCYINQIPDQVNGETAGMQQWTWTAGKIDFDQKTNWGA